MHRSSDTPARPVEAGPARRPCDLCGEPCAVSLLSLFRRQRPASPNARRARRINGLTEFPQRRRECDPGPVGGLGVCKALEAEIAVWEGSAQCHRQHCWQMLSTGPLRCEKTQKTEPLGNTAVDIEYNLSYSYGALASWRLCSMHRSSDTHRARPQALPGRAKTNI